jgi:hypothetical protein
MVWVAQSDALLSRKRQWDCVLTACASLLTLPPVLLLSTSSRSPRGAQAPVQCRVSGRPRAQPHGPDAFGIAVCPVSQ